ncbi:hypothetical protein FGG08_006373 [Glutinoglossum americanum]|uniref:Oxidoreductase n=1 Tax=Glutinoglossum americanum TaxID=1670608 RepID=A0A9P8I5D5_9PEZI|nr:hypothetical protein FGG08_006373 [Glutinoglossum americanum]
MTANKAYAIIAGVGAGTGASVARKFAQTYPVALLARNPANYTSLVSEINDSGGKAIGIPADVTSGEGLRKAVEEVKKEFPEGDLAAAVYNVGGAFIRKPFLEMGEVEFRAGYEANGIGAFHFSQSMLPLLLESTHLKHPATLIFTGATASLRGSAQSSSFATGKFALRALAQSLAREFGPKRVHVAHLIVDGGIDGLRVREFSGIKGEDVGDRFISPEGVSYTLLLYDPTFLVDEWLTHVMGQIADAYWHLHTQPASAFTFELDIRPYAERW